MTKLSYAGTTADSLSYARRIAIQGGPGSGKTWAALTFPNLIVCNLDNKLGAHPHRTDVQVLHFHNEDWTNKILAPIICQLKTSTFGTKENFRAHDAIILWLQTEGAKLDPSHTVVIDSDSLFEDSIHVYYESNPIASKEGKDSGFKIWNKKKELWILFFKALRNLPCTSVTLFHEAYPMDADGKVLGKLLPVLQGSMKESVSKNFTEWFRQTAEQDKITKQMQYLWQVKPDGDCGCFSSYPKLTASKEVKVPANYSSLV